MKKCHRWDWIVPYTRTSVSRPAICRGCDAKLWQELSAKSRCVGGIAYVTMVQIPGSPPVPYSQVPPCRPKRRAA